MEDKFAAALLAERLVHAVACLCLPGISQHFVLGRIFHPRLGFGSPLRGLRAAIAAWIGEQSSRGLGGLLSAVDWWIST